MNTKKVSVGLVLASVALQCAALTIGPARGAAWIGRPLELSIPVVHDTLSDATALCVHADVYYAETRQDASRVQIQQEPTDQADTVRLRLQSSTPIDEPVVTVNLRVGCEDKSVRRFVLLADFPVFAEVPSELAPIEMAVTLATASDLEPATSRAPSASLPREATNTGATAVPAPKAQVTSAARHAHKPTGVGRSAAPRMTGAKINPSALTAKPPGSPRSRLQLDSVDILLERIKTLEAAAVTPPMETVSKDSERLQKLESDLQSLREQTAKNGATLLALQRQLERAETQRVSTEWFYGLVGLVLLCAVIIVTLWHRRRAPQAWNEGPPFEPDSEPEPYEAQFLRKTSNTGPLDAAPIPMPPIETEPENVDLQVDVNLVEFEEPQWSDVNPAPAKRF